MRVTDEIIKLKNSSRGSIVKFITVGDIENISMAVPNNEDVELFSQMNSIMKLIGENIKANEKLSELRDWLLPMLMNGQVTVGDAEKMVEEKMSMAAEPSVKYGKK
jgi:type I restriction enzyme S subunit